MERSPHYSIARRTVLLGWLPKRKIAIASLILYAATACGQVTTPLLNNVYQVDGVTNATIQSIYNSPNFSGGTIYWNLSPGTTVSYPFDIFENTAPIPMPTITFIPTLSCGGLSGLTPGLFLSVFVGEYDGWGNWNFSPVVQPAATPAGDTCYTITWSNSLFTGWNSAFTGSSSTFAVFALQCSTTPCATTTGQNPPLSGTLQFSSGLSAGSPGYYAFSAPVAPTTYFYGYSNSSSAISFGSAGPPATGCFILTGSATCPTAAVAPAGDQGLLISNTTIHINTNGGIFQHFQSVIPWGSRLVMDNPVNGGYAQLSQSSPNSIPTLPNIYGSILSAGATNSIGHQVSEIICLYTEPWFGQTPELVNCSFPNTSPQYTATTQAWEFLAPAPPYIYQARVASTYYSVGALVSDQHTPECVWLVTVAGTTNSGPSAFPTCSTEGSTPYLTDGSVSYLLVRKGRTWASGQIYLLGTILTNAGIDYEVIANGGGAMTSSAPCAGSTLPCFNPNFGGCDTSKTSCAMTLGDGYQYQAISTVAQGPNLLVAPQFQVFGRDLAGPVQITGTPNVNYKALSSTNYYQWSGCSGTSGIPPQSNSGTCNTSGSSTNTAVVLSFTDGTPLNGSLPTTVGGSTYIADGGPCPTGRGGCTSITSSTYYANYTQGSPVGIIPLSIGEASAAITIHHAIVITGPPLPGTSCTNPGCPAPDAVGWMAGLTKVASGLETMQVPDGINAYCGSNGSPSAYVPNLPHGALCMFGQTETIVNVQTAKPYFPMFNVSEAVFSIGGMSPLQTQNGNPLTATGLQGYGARIEDWTEDCGRTALVGEPYAWFAFSSDGQEESGAYRSKQRDCMNGYFYGNGPGNQNTSVYIGHVLGQSQDYTVGTLIQDVPSFRLFSDHSASGFQQGGFYVSQFGVGLFTSPMWNSVGPIGGQIQSVGCEIAFDCVQLRDAKGVTLTNIFGSTTRPMNNLIHADYLTRDFSISGSNATNANCALFYELFTIINTGCTTTSAGVGFIAAGDVGGTASTAERVISTDSGLSMGTATCVPGAPTTLTDAATITWAINSANCAGSTLLFTAHSGSRILDLTGLVAGASLTILLTQDTTGGESLTGGTGCTWKQPGGGGSTFTLTNAPNAIDLISIYYDGANCVSVLTKNYS
jgi:hypothetical protein